MLSNSSCSKPFRSTIDSLVQLVGITLYYSNIVGGCALYLAVPVHHLDVRNNPALLIYYHHYLLHTYFSLNFLSQLTNECNVSILQSLIVICILRPRNHSLTFREKNCRLGRKRPRQHNLKDENDINETIYFVNM
jgi:hypothetical protein